MPRRSLSTLIGLVLISSPHISLADTAHQDGWNALARQDYETAHKFCLAPAKEGNALSQTCMGLLYAKGLGVPKDAQEAFKWFRLAAEQGEGIAQVRLGAMYTEGHRKNPILAYKWLSLAAAQGYQSNVTSINQLEQKMSPSDLEKAQKLVANWQPKSWEVLSKHLTK